MRGAAVAATFENVEKAREIGIEVGMGILQRVAHARLRGQVHHRTEAAVAEDGLGTLAVGKIELVKSEVLELPQHRKPRFLERGVIIIIDTVNADDRTAAFKKPPRQRKADKARGAGDQDGILRHRHLRASFRPAGQHHSRHSATPSGR